MNYKNKSYSWVNEKKIDGKTVTIYRCDSNPKKCIKSIDGKVEKSLDNKDMKKEWRKLGKVYSDN